MEQFEIGEVARRAGLRPSAIRYYESIGVLPPPTRVNGRRRYDEDVLKLLMIVQVAQKAGFSVAEIKTLLSGFPPGTPASTRWQGLAHSKLDEVKKRVEELQSMKRLLELVLQCECLDLNECAVCIAGSRADMP
jgi:MerR family redox-sensitive transcriptional activator SoxR